MYTISVKLPITPIFDLIKGCTKKTIHWIMSVNWKLLAKDKLEGDFGEEICVRGRFMSPSWETYSKGRNDC